MAASKSKPRKSDHSQESEPAAHESPAGAKDNPSRYMASRETDTASRQEMIAVAAYFLAERRGFCPGAELDDWARAEEEIDRLLAEHGGSS